MSPRLRLSSTAWNTSGTPASNTMNWAIDNLPTSGNQPTSALRFNFDRNGGGYSTILSILDNGNVGIGTTSPGNALNIASSTGFVSGLRLGISSSSPTTNSNGKALSVNNNGDVVLSSIMSDNTLSYSGSILTSTVNGLSATTTINIPTYTLGGLGGISLSSLSASGPISYNNSTGLFSISQSSSSSDGYLSSGDWNTFNNKLSNITGLISAGTNVILTGLGTNASPYVINAVTGGSGGGGGLTSLNGLTSPIQAFVNDTNFTITSSGSNHTLGWSGLLSIARGGTNSSASPVLGGLAYGDGSSYQFTNAGTSGQILQSNGAAAPSWVNAPWITSLSIPTGSNVNGGSILGNVLTLSLADANNPGLVSTTSQIFAGAKTFSSAPTFSTFTNGSVLFGGSGGLLSQDNSNFFWNNTSKQLGIGTSTPGAMFHIASTTANLVDMFKITGTSSRNLLRVQQNTDDNLDVERVIIGQGGISASTPDALAHDQLYVFGRINSSWNSISANFVGSWVSVSADTALNSGLVFDMISATASFAPASVVGTSGVGRITTTTTANAGGAVGTNGAFPTQRSLNPVFETKVIVNTTANTRAIAGFSTRATGGNLTVDTNNTTEEAFFRKNLAGTNWEAVTRTGSGTENITTLATACAGGTACTVNTMRTLRVELQDTPVGIARFYIDGTLVASATTTAPASATRLGYDVVLTNTTTTAATLDIGYIRMWSDDPASDMNSSSTVNSLIPVNAGSTDISNQTEILTSESKLPSYISVSKQVMTDLQFTMNNMSTTTSEALASSTNLVDGNDLTIQQYGENFVQLIKSAIEKLSDIFVNVKLWVKSLKADKVETKELCLEDVCVTKEQLKVLLQNSGQNSSNNNINTNDTSTTTTLDNNTQTNTNDTSTTTTLDNNTQTNTTDSTQ